MARRATDDGSVSIYQGRYHRTLGRILNERGEAIAKKFLLGTDKRAAEEANRRLTRLWQEVVAEHEAAVRWMRDLGPLRLGDANGITGDVDRQKLRRLDLGPLWRAESLMIAEAIRKGSHQIAVLPCAEDAERPGAYLERLARLRRTYSVIGFTAAPHLQCDRVHGCVA